MRSRFLLYWMLVLGSSFGCAAESSAVVGNTGQIPLITVATFGANDGFQPGRSLVLGTDGAFYGVTGCGGASVSKENRLGYGTVFRVTTNGILTTLFSFQGTNGADPEAGLTVGKEGVLYGLTYVGGTNLGGVVFRISTNGEEKVLHNFGGTDGWDNGIRKSQHLQQWQGCAAPIGRLLLGKDGNFYGKTQTGGFDYGTVFKMSSNGDLTYIFAFDRTNGYGPSAELTQDAEGNLYGTATFGGPNGRSHGGYGTIFKINPEGKLLWYFGFNGTNGLHPSGGLAMGPNGSFYGSTSGGWYTNPSDGHEMAQNQGTIFKITTNGVLTTLVWFGNTNGACPVGRLLLASDGNFYGAVRFLNGVGLGSDEPMGNGAIFKMTPAGNLRIVAAFDNGDWNTGPTGGLTEGLDGDLYGLTGGGGTSCVFKLRVRTLHFGDTAPLRAALGKLKVGKVSGVRFSPVAMFGDNSVTAYFGDSGGSELMLTAKAYDSKEAAKAGLENDQRWVSVHWNERQVINGVDVYAYTNYGRMDFQVGPYTFVLNAMGHGKENMQLLLRDVSSELIGEFKP